ncbi:uncharacterized protein RAG0_01862 [Rhynchosporium agropyri]|uniref:Uncharacterized protein n=1 Tax=Rhynchosporium agropyri TaxID=914238 RepID=A0A1E1JZ40_9HELO|nr:uncharacterized protein RAG0_01862 [Rhynchosporium agropyri]
MDDWESNNEVVASWGEAREKGRMELVEWETTCGSYKSIPDAGGGRESLLFSGDRCAGPHLRSRSIIPPSCLTWPDLTCLLDRAWSHRVQLKDILYLSPTPLRLVGTVYGTVTVLEVSVWCNIACQSFAKYKKDSANAAVHAAELHTPPSEEGLYRSITEPHDKNWLHAYKVRRLIHALKDNLTRPQ